MSSPGFPIQNGYSLGIQIGNPYPNADQLREPTHIFISAHLIKFDRINRLAEVRFSTWRNSKANLFEEAMRSLPIRNCSQAVFLMESSPYDDSKNTIDILEEIGNPSNAKADKNAILAMGKRVTKRVAGTDPKTPASMILWEANKLVKISVRNRTEVNSIAAKANSLSRHPLNKSQIDAIKGCSRSQLGIIWGPPGTGKTDTLSVFIHALVSEASNNQHGRKILITGPNYRAVLELLERTIKSLESDSTLNIDIFNGFSRSREPTIFTSSASNIHGGSLRFTEQDPLYSDFHTSMGDPNSITIVATASHAIPSMTTLLGYSQNISPLFDLVVIDESSQVPVTLALRPLAVLKENAQLVVAGDHMQMPPITSLDAPVGAEYLVGSIQTYLLKRFTIKPLPLLVNYRSAEDIVAYARSLDYPQGLTSNFPGLKLHLLKNPKDIARTSGIVYSQLIDDALDPNKAVLTLIHEDIASSQANPEEAEIVVSLIWHLYCCTSNSLDGGDSTPTHSPVSEDEFFDSIVGVVTPHKAQKALIVSKLKQLFSTADQEKIFSAVDTVERFQGGQRHTIIISFGVGDSDIVESEEEFLMQLERTNVAVSRAMAKCIMVMPKSLAYHLPSDKKVAQSAKALKSYIDEFCSEHQRYVVPLRTGNREFELRWH